MATSSPVSTRNPGESSGNENLQNTEQTHGTSSSSNVRTGERIITPTQPPVQYRSLVEHPLLRGVSRGSSADSPMLAALRGAVVQNALGHPFAYARMLMQMGFEPLPVYRGKTLFGKEAFYHPHIFRYLKHVYQIDGFVGLYRGFGCSLLSKVVFLCATTKCDEILGPVDSKTSNEQQPPSWNKCIEKILREVQAQSWGVLISHPFHVVAIRCMGQFVGREKAYSSINIFQNFNEIYERQGIGGFFVGLMPRWLLEISTVVITNVLIYLLKSQLSTQHEMVSLYEYLATFIAQTVTYPLNVVTTVTAINGSGLRAGMLPITPIYANWHHAYNYLKKTEQLKRGSSFFNRVASATSGLPTVGSRIPNA